MNPGLGSDHASIHYYDSDYPSPFDTLFPENFDQKTEYQGLAFDIQRFLQLVARHGGPVLELGCGTGRVAIPLARECHSVTGVDISAAMLQKFRKVLEQEKPESAARITLIEQDATKLDLQAKFKTAIFAFNSLLCIPDFPGQCAALQAVAKHLAPGGKLFLDMVNPLQLNIQGDPVPKPFFTRRDRNTGNPYTRFAMMGPFDQNHRQQLHGWYDEVLPDGAVKRRPYSLFWRPIFRFEIDLMLRQAGMEIIQIEGGHRNEPYTAQSPWMLVIAEKM